MKITLPVFFAKKKGDIENILFSLICITTCFVIITIGINYVGAAKEYLDANQIARKYLLKMETAGYLSPAVSNELINEMQEKGFTSVSLEGSTFNKGNFGDDICLNISYVQKMNILFSTKSGFQKGTKDQVVRIKLSSAAKG